jgi:hypothetical protein
LDPPSRLRILANGAAVAVATFAAAAGLIAFWDSLNPWAQGFFGWLAIEGAFYALQCWRYGTVFLIR